MSSPSRAARRRRRTRRGSPRHGRRLRHGLEALESRRLLATLSVTTTLDALDLDPGDGVCEIVGGGCSLRAAIQEINALDTAGAPHQINLPAGTYGLTIEGSDESGSLTGDLNVRASVAIVGAGAANTTIDAGGIDRVLDVALGNVTIQGMTIRGGVVGADELDFEFTGGGIRNQANLTLVDSVVTGNVAGSGAGIANYGGTLRVERSVITGNGDASTSRGGGLFNYSYYDATDVEIIESTISENRAIDGGGLMNSAYDGAANAVIRRSTISGNSATSGGAIVNRSSLYYEPTSLANLSIRNSTISGNTADGSGGGIDSQTSDGGETQTDVLNSTITGNVATGLDGGGIHSSDSPQVTTVIRSTIVAGNSAAREGDDLFGSSISGTFNLVGDSRGHSLVDGIDNNLVGVAPLLGPLASNGGPTLTHALLDGSPAIDQGSNSLPLLTDQRGSAFVRTVDVPSIVNALDGTDIGAVEVGQVAAAFDFGDAPDGVEVGGQRRRYATLSSSDGARHQIDPFGPFLGRVRPDGEPDGQSSMSANGDDLFGSDDEDAFAATPIVLTPGQPLGDVVISHDGGPTGAFLNVWLDVNVDGDFDDPGEQLVADLSVRPGPHATSLADLNLPSDAVTGTSFIRARIGTETGLRSSGQAIDGEVEDVQVAIGNVPIEIADLSLQQTVDNPNPVIGETVTFTITVKNAGPDRATNVETTNLLPPELLFERATVSQGIYEFEETWFVGTLEPGASAELRITVTVDSSDSIQHTAEVTFSDQFDPNSTPGNGVSGEDDQATVTLGTCLTGGPLHVGLNRFSFSCADPGAWVGFVHGTTRGEKTFEQYNVTVDIADAEGIAIAIADSSGIASISISLSDDELDALFSGDPLIVQAFEMLPRRTKSNTLVIDERLVMLEAATTGAGGRRLRADEVEAIADAARARWASDSLSESMRERMNRSRTLISDLPGNALARLVGSTIIVDVDAAGNGWFVDATPEDDREFVATKDIGKLEAIDPEAGGQIDLLTTLMHEYGHLLGMPHTSILGVMHPELDVGVRRVPGPALHPGDPHDVNGDGSVTALDALVIINWLASEPATPQSVALRRDILDINADSQVTAADALAVVNRLARREDATAEQEGLLWLDGIEQERRKRNRFDIAIQQWLLESES